MASMALASSCSLGFGAHRPSLRSRALKPAAPPRSSLLSRSVGDHARRLNSAAAVAGAGAARLLPPLRSLAPESGARRSSAVKATAATPAPVREAAGTAAAVVATAAAVVTAAAVGTAAAETAATAMAVTAGAPGTPGAAVPPRVTGGSKFVSTVLFSLLKFA